MLISSEMLQKFMKIYEIILESHSFSEKPDKAWLNLLFLYLAFTYLRHCQTHI